MVCTDPPYGVPYQVTLSDSSYARRRRRDGAAHTLPLELEDPGEPEGHAKRRRVISVRNEADESGEILAGQASELGLGDRRQVNGLSLLVHRH